MRDEGRSVYFRPEGQAGIKKKHTLRDEYLDIGQSSELIQSKHTSWISCTYGKVCNNAAITMALLDPETAPLPIACKRLTFKL